MAGMGVGEAALLSAALGGGAAAATGNDPLKGALLGGLGGAAFGGLGAASGAMPGAAAGTAGTAAGTAGALGTGITAGQTAGLAGLQSSLAGVTPTVGLSASPGLSTALSAGGAEAAGAALGAGITPSAATASTFGAAPATTPSFFASPSAWWSSLTPTQKLMYGGGAGLGLLALSESDSDMPGPEKYTGPLSRFRYNPDTYRPSLPMAEGGIAELPPQEPAVTFMRSGGISDLGSYSDGGRLLKGPGDGMSDNIPATIADKRPARLADGEFVIPADVVSHLGNGSTDAGAKQLYAMMDRVRQSRTGNKKQGREIRPQKFMPA